jgi:hypothetical protein
MKLKKGQKVFFVVKDEDKRELSYQKATFLYAVSGGHKGRCMISTIFNGQELKFIVSRTMIYTSEKDVREEVIFEANLFGWRAAI